MRKTVNISIGRSLFVIDEHAYAQLDAYLTSIRSHFGDTTDAAEIIADIEDRIAEELEEKLSAKKKVILPADVGEVIRRMGTVEDFKKFESETGGASENTQEKFFTKVRLYRNADDKVIGGVASGIANYFGIDPIIIRLAFGLSLFMGGFGFVLYILLWIILPEAKTTAEKVEMTGGRLTLSAIQSRIEKAIPSEKHRSTMRKILAFPFLVIGKIFQVIGRILAFLFPVLGRILGVIVMLWATFGIAIATFVLFALLLNPSSPYIGFPLHEAFGAMPFLFFIFSAYFLILVPLLFVLLIGTCLVLMRSVFSLPVSMGLAALWFIALVSLGVTGFTAAPQIEAVATRFNAEHFALMEKPVDARDFESIAIRNHVQAKIVRGNAHSMIVRAPKNYLDTVIASVKDGTLFLERAPRPGTHCILFCPHGDVTVEITMPRLGSLEAEAHSYVSVSGFTDDIRYAATDHSMIDASVTAKNAVIDVRSHSVVELTGSGTTMTLHVKDHSMAGLEEFPVTALTLDVRSHSSATVTATEKMSGAVTDHSYVLYDGMPAAVDVKTSDQSNIEQRDEEEWED